MKFVLKQIGWPCHKLFWCIRSDAEYDLPSLSWTFKPKQTDCDLSSVLLILTWSPCTSLAIWEKRMPRFRMYPHYTAWISNSYMVCNKSWKAIDCDSAKALAADGRADFKPDWQTCWECDPRNSHGEKTVNPCILRNICISQKHFWICKERTFRPLDRKEGCLPQCDGVQSNEHYNKQYPRMQRSLVQYAIDKPVQHLN